VDYLELLRILLKWVVDRSSRLVLQGYRPEVICLIRGTDVVGKYLLVSSRAHQVGWAPPQEGLELNESIEDAVKRCLLNELGLEESSIQFRKSAWIGKRILHHDRWGERDLRYSLRGLIGQEQMIGKGYFAALVIVDSNATITANPAEISDWAWFEPQQYAEQVATTPPDKAEILRKAQRLEILSNVVDRR
jgi:ADP-ribose pyrophosphatase YjhB (NUDIX family)